MPIPIQKIIVLFIAGIACFYSSNVFTMKDEDILESEILEDIAKYAPGDSLEESLVDALPSAPLADSSPPQIEEYRPATIIMSPIVHKKPARERPLSEIIEDTFRLNRSSEKHTAHQAAFITKITEASSAAHKLLSMGDKAYEKASAVLAEYKNYLCPLHHKLVKGIAQNQITFVKASTHILSSSPIRGLLSFDFGRAITSRLSSATQNKLLGLTSDKEREQTLKIYEKLEKQISKNEVDPDDTGKEWNSLSRRVDFATFRALYICNTYQDDHTGAIERMAKLIDINEKAIPIVILRACYARFLPERDKELEKRRIMCKDTLEKIKKIISEYKDDEK